MIMQHIVLVAKSRRKLTESAGEKYPEGDQMARHQVNSFPDPCSFQKGQQVWDNRNEWCYMQSMSGVDSLISKLLIVYYIKLIFIWACILSQLTVCEAEWVNWRTQQGGTPGCCCSESCTCIGILHTVLQCKSDNTRSKLLEYHDMHSLTWSFDTYDLQSSEVGGKSSENAGLKCSKCIIPGQRPVHSR